MGKLDGKVAIITGAASGMGKATAKLFVQEGAKVVVADIQDELGKETVKTITESGGKAIFVHTDVRKAEDVKNMIKTAVDTYGKLDILFNNAGIEGVMADTLNYPDEVVEDVIATNFKGVWFGVKYGVEQLLKTGGGVIINTASITGHIGTPYMSAYAATKSAVISLTRTAGQEYASRGVRVNCIAPGSIDTPMLQQAFKGRPEALASSAKRIPMGRIGKPEEIAKAALFLASDESSFVTGQTLDVDGGAIPH
jgi:NAD(P)-dependent dehydrogenase (short-subunit alcohol dehydrogenase family)